VAEFTRRVCSSTYSYALCVSYVHAMRRLMAAMAAVLLGCAGVVTTAGRATATTGLLLPAPASVRVSGNHLVDQFGIPLRLLGVNRDGAEWACSSIDSVFDGPTSDDSIAAMAAWHINTVRLPISEHCWLGINGAPAAFSGEPYRAAIVDYVNRLHAHGLVVILDLHTNGPGSALSSNFLEMPDRDHTPALWRSVATRFKSDPGVLFDLFNEPHSSGTFTLTWDCWLHGCMVTGESGHFQAAGMQELVDAVRSTGATQPILLGGLGYADDLRQWIAHEPHDSAGQLVASVHVYNFNYAPTDDGSPCDAACLTDAWNRNQGVVAKTVPVVTGEIGEDDCQHGFVDQYMSWADSYHISYLGWTWNTGGDWTCTGGPTLITNYDGTPSGLGAGLHDHLASRVLTDDIYRLLALL